MREDCLYLGMCKRDCNTKSCLRYDETKFMLDSSNIPASKRKVNVLIPDDCDMQAFEQLADIRDHIVDFVLSGSNLYIYSETCGNGKTTWGIKLLLQYVNDIWIGNCFKERVLFINVNSFLFALKDSFSVQNESIEKVKRLIPTVDLVVWDDIAANKMSSYDTDLILSLLDQRIVNGKANIFTGNIMPGQLSTKLGDRIASRVAGQEVKKIHLCGCDRR